MADYSPLFRTTVGPFDISEGAQEVDVERLGRSLTYVSVTPSQDAVPATPHQLGINTATPYFDMKEAADYEVKLDAARLGADSPLLISKVHVKAGKDATSFTIIGHV